MFFAMGSAMTPNPLKLCVVNGKPALDARLMSMASAPCQVWLFGFTDDVYMQEGLAELLARDEHERARAFVVLSARNRHGQTRGGGSAEPRGGEEGVGMCRLRGGA